MCYFQKVLDDEAEELVDVITCCITRLEILESYQYAVMRSPVIEAVSLANVIACCITRLEIIDYDESARQELYAKVNDKNRKRC
ncbi:MAG: hypothetical protein IJS29_04800 [Selenomonadaceae bacterium]|nr:hypothetical protein [Selenomonadaceae bacterium]